MIYRRERRFPFHKIEDHSQSFRNASIKLDSLLPDEIADAVVWRATTVSAPSTTAFGYATAVSPGSIEPLLAHPE
jgi:hypothetical protein